MRRPVRNDLLNRLNQGLGGKPKTQSQLVDELLTFRRVLVNGIPFSVDLLELVVEV